MRRVLIGSGTPTGRHLSAIGAYSERLTYARTLQGFTPADEIVLICPSLAESAKSSRLKGQLLKAVTDKAKRLIVITSLDAFPTRSLPFCEASLDYNETNLIGFHTADLRTAGSWLGHLKHERRLAEAAKTVTILRVPDIFGPGLVKGVPGYLLDKNANQANRVAIHQWYPVHRLERDMIIARHLKVPAINLCAEPLRMDAILSELFPHEVGRVITPAPYSRIKTRYGEAFGGSGSYIMSARAVLAEIKRYVQLNRRLRGVKPAFEIGQIETTRRITASRAISETRVA